MNTDLKVMKLLAGADDILIFIPRNNYVDLPIRHKNLQKTLDILFSSKKKLVDGQQLFEAERGDI